MPAGQAQKEFTLNEALLRADLAIQCAVEGVAATPPPDPLAGQAWIVGAEPSGAFAGHQDAVAGWTDGGWRFLAAAPGHRVYDKTAGCFRHFAGTWHLPATPPAPIGGATIDAEARATLVSILEKLIGAGIFATS